MKILSAMLMIIFLSITHLSYAQNETHDDDIDVTTSKEYKDTNKELDEIYQKILQEYKSQPVFIKNFKKSQKIWLQLRAAELETRFPDDKISSFGSGSINVMCKSSYLTELTKERVNYLKLWLNGVEEGDVCIGNIKIKRY